MKLKVLQSSAVKRINKWHLTYSVGAGGKNRAACLVFGFNFYVDRNTKSKFKSDWDRSHSLSQTVLDLDLTNVIRDLNGEFG